MRCGARTAEMLFRDNTQVGQLRIHWIGTDGKRITNSKSLCNSQGKGYQMARNLQSKLSPSDSIRLFDINTASAERLAKEMHAQTGGAGASISSSVQEAAQDAVSLVSSLPSQHNEFHTMSYDLHLLTGVIS